MITLPHPFEIAYLINLPERTDRLASAKKQFARVGWTMGTNDLQLFPALRFADAAGFPNAPTRGCFLSHLECLRRANAAGRQSILLIEDDIGLPRSLPRITEAIEFRRKLETWDFLYFGHYGTGEIASADKKTSGDQVEFRSWRGDILGTHFYAVGGRILSRLIAHLEATAAGPPGDPKCGPMPLDGAYNIFRDINPDVRCLIAIPKLGWQSSSRSDIWPSRFDRWSFLHPAGNVLRSVKRSWTSWRS